MAFDCLAGVNSLPKPLGIWPPARRPAMWVACKKQGDRTASGNTKWAEAEREDRITDRLDGGCMRNRWDRYGGGGGKG